ncbi:PREDICTED: probable chitinase 3 [Polistes dominula]|uniref:Probable chitinase 3 n=1 Tax=Polistes dominula TaxID=743375 RepID=A0ABM1IK23_POLDO|nr:PREDICTED: probable chitinase 3 [Polistes dominula]
MKGSYSWIAIFAIILAVIGVDEAAKLTKLPNKYSNNYSRYVCEENTKEPHESKCNIYYKCINKQLVLKECESGLHWDRTKKVCTTPDKADCPNNYLKVCKEGTYKPNSKECDRYYKCENSQYVLKSCKDGYHWNRESNICTDPEDAGCSTVPLPPPVCEEGSFKPHESKCNIYYKCINKQLVLKECKNGLHWDRTNYICTLPEKAKCPNYHPKVCDEGSYKHNDKECNSYYKCKNNQWDQKQCPNGMHWNREHTICTAPDEAKCQNDWCRDGSYRPREDLCDSYYKCQSNQWINKQCPTGMHWNREHTICTSPDVANCPNYPKCEEGSYKPSDDKCDRYYKCKNNQWDQKQCANGMHWNQRHTICTLPDEAKCHDDDSGLCKEGSYKPHNKTCNRYYKCKNNQWDHKICPTGMQWNQKHSICLSSDEANCSNNLFNF